MRKEFPLKANNYIKNQIKTFSLTISNSKNVCDDFIRIATP